MVFALGIVAGLIGVALSTVAFLRGDVLLGLVFCCVNIAGVEVNARRWRNLPRRP